jgi:hypothetical protein
MKGSIALILIILVIFGMACLQPVLADEQGADSVNVTSPEESVAGSGQVTYAANSFVAATATTAPTPTPYIPTGSFQISSNPSGASVWVDGAFAGMTPITVTGLTQGNHLVEVEKTGYMHWETQAYAQVGAITNIFAGLVAGTSPTKTPTTTVTTTPTVTGPTTVPTPAYGYLYVQSDPTEAKVYVDGTYRGITPMVISEATTGYHLVMVNKTGYQIWQEQVYVWGDKTSNVVANLVLVTSPTTVPTGTTTATTIPTTSPTTNPTPVNNYASSATFGIYSNPTGASIYIDSVYQGVTPLVVTGLTQGTHTVKLQKTGYKTWQTTAYGQVGAITTLFAALEPGVDPTVTGTATVTTTIPTPSAPPLYGTLAVVSFPANASIWIDGVNKGTTPKVFSDTPVGNHTVKLEKTGYKTWQSVATVTQGNTTRIVAALVATVAPGTSPTTTKTPFPTVPTPTKTPTATPTPIPTGTLMVISFPTNASVYLDNAFKGYTPDILPGVQVGNHTVMITMANYEPWKTTVNVQKGTTTRIIANLVPGFV